MWKKQIALTVAAVLAGSSGHVAVAQGYYGESGYYDQYGYDRYNGGYSERSSYDQYGSEVSFSYFHDVLAPHGNWYHHQRWGQVWRPVHAGRDFRPYYSDGYWRNTIEFGWVWVSNYDWGHIPFHYGRWVLDPYDGWIWLPGYVWAPSWVIWRGGGGHIGWFPMPPTRSFMLGIEIYNNRWDDWGSGFGYSSWYGPSYGANWSTSLWVFVDQRHFGHRNFHRWVAPRSQVINIVRNTTNITNYVTINNYVVNQSINTTAIESASGQRFTPLPAREVVRHDAPVTRVDRGRQIEERERVTRPRPAPPEAVRSREPQRLQQREPAPRQATTGVREQREPIARPRPAPQEAAQQSQRETRQARGGRNAERDVRVNPGRRR